MSAEEELSERRREARRALEDAPDGRLPLPYRRRIRAVFGPCEGPLPDVPLGRRRRVALARLSAERVLPVWEAERPQDRRPQRMLELAEALLEGREDPVVADRELGDFMVEVGTLGSGSSPAISARADSSGMAAIDVLATGLSGDYGPDLPETTDDDDLDPDSWETEYYASLAAGSYPGAPDEDVEARRAFWRWYLDEAAPAAYRSAGG